MTERMNSLFVIKWASERPSDCVTQWATRAIILFSWDRASW